MVHPPNWQEIEQSLYEQGKSTIEQFAEEHPDLTCSFFACVADPLSGEFAFCFDIPENAAYEAMKQELVMRGRRRSREERSGRAEAWRHAHAELSQSLLDYAPDSSLFQYPLYTRISFNWLEFTDSRAYPEPEEGQAHYLEGQTLLVVWKVLERLVAERVFASLHMTSPFRVGYQFAEASLIVLCFLNWPAPGGQTLYSVFDSPLTDKEQRTKGSPLKIKQVPDQDSSDSGEQHEQEKDLPNRFSEFSESHLAKGRVSQVEIGAFPSSLKERPWSKDIEVVMNASHSAFSIQVIWPRIPIELDGLGRIEVSPTLLSIQMEAPLQGSPHFILYDQDQHELGTLVPGSSLAKSVSSFAEQNCWLRGEVLPGTFQQGEVLILRVRLHAFQARLSLSPRNLWWLKAGEEQRKWQGNTLDYLDAHFLLDDLSRHVDRLIAEAGVIGYMERRRKLASLLFALGQVAQAIEAYPRAIQFYWKSEQKFRSLRDIEMRERILRILRDLYLRQGMKDQAKRITFTLLELKTSL